MSKKLIGILGILGIVLIYLIVCFLSPSVYKFNKEIKVDGPYKMVYLILNDVKDWPKWYSWKKQDPDLIFNLGGREHHLGANFSFESSKFGNGYVEITQSFQDSFVSANLKTDKLPATLQLSWQIIPQDKKSVYVDIKARIPGMIPFYKRGLYYGMKSRMDQMLDADIDGIKTYIEGLVNSNFNAAKVLYPGKKYFGLMDVVVNSKIPQFYAKTYPKIYAKLDSMNIEVAGPPAGLILDWEAKTGYVFIMAALPVNEKLPNMAGWTFFDLKPTECLKLEHYGSYRTLRNAHAQLSYMLDNSPFTLGIPVIEEYVTSPSQEPDTSKWLTNIYYLFDKQGGYSKTVEQKKTLEDVIKMEEAERNEKLKDLIN